MALNENFLNKLYLILRTNLELDLLASCKVALAKHSFSTFTLPFPILHISKQEVRVIEVAVARSLESATATATARASAAATTTTFLDFRFDERCWPTTAV